MTLPLRRWAYCAKPHIFMRDGKWIVRHRHISIPHVRRGEALADAHSCVMSGKKPVKRA